MTKHTHNKLKVLDLFSGIGMFSYGLHKTGLYETVSFCEWEKSCQKVLRKNFPGISYFSDIANLQYLDGCLQSEEDNKKVVTSVDVIVGGFPCQDISEAGKREGIKGKRSSYWKHFARLIDEVKPKGVIIENVSALLRRGLHEVLRDLNSLGYDAEWHCITVKHFGAYHERDRVWIIAYRNNNRKQGHEPIQCTGEDRQRGKDRQADMQQMFQSPFRRSDCWPQPLIRGVDVQRPFWVDRIGQIGNTVYWPIVKFLGYELHKRIT